MLFWLSDSCVFEEIPVGRHMRLETAFHWQSVYSIYQRFKTQFNLWIDTKLNLFPTEDTEILLLFQVMSQSLYTLLM